MICSIEGCDRTAVTTSGWCKKHYDQDRRSRLPRCPVEDCNNAVILRHGVCMPCHRRHLRNGSLDRPNPAGRCHTNDGYVRLYRPDHPMATSQGWVLEHRLVAYDAGLLDGPSDRRHVHHRNHDKTDNCLANLEVLTNSDHGRAHAAIDWDSAARMYEAGATTTEVAAAFGTHPGNVSRALRARGVVMRPAHRHRNAPSKGPIER